MPTLDEIKPQIESFAPYTKKDLVSLYEITLNTVTATLKACGVPTAVVSYSAEQIQRFHVAREWIAQGKNYTEVTAHFCIGNETKFDAPPNATGHGQAQAQEGMTAADVAAFKLVNQAARASANKAGKAFVPLFLTHLGNQLSSPEFSHELDRAIGIISPAVSDTEVNDFLLQGMATEGLLPPTMQPAMLPPSLPSLGLGAGTSVSENLLTPLAADLVGV